MQIEWPEVHDGPFISWTTRHLSTEAQWAYADTSIFDEQAGSVAFNLKAKTAEHDDLDITIGLWAPNLLSMMESLIQKWERFKETDYFKECMEMERRSEEARLKANGIT